jgi:serine-type D-Ala-D-Ala carboxypeptidase/endopeptidase
VICVGGFAVVSIFSLVVISFIPSLVGRNPVLLEALGGSAPSMVAAGAFARVGRTTLIAALAAPVVGLAGFDWLPWWAGRRYGGGAMDMLAGRSDRSRRLAARAERLFARYGWATIVGAYYLPIPNVIVYAAAGSTGMPLPVFLVLDLTGALLRIGLVVGLGYAIGQRAVSVASAVSHYALLSLLVMTLVLVAYHLLRNRLGRPGSDAAPPVSPLPAWPPLRTSPGSRFTSDGALTELVERHLRPLVEQGIAPGIVYAAVSPGGSALGCLTTASGQRLSASSLLEIGSITKVFTAILLADMAGRGEVALDDPITRYLRGSTTNGGPSITLLDLATHTSGLPRLPTNLLLPALRHPADPYAAYGTDRLVRAATRSMSKGRTPGTYRYSNYGFGLLGHVLASAAGQPYEDLIRERICELLGLPDTVITVSPDREDRRAAGHRRTKAAAPWHLSALAGAGGLHSTGADLLTFLRANLAPMTTPLANALNAAQRPCRHIGPEALIGLAWHHTLNEHTHLLWHNGGTGGFSSIILIDQANGSAIAAVATTAPTRTFPLDHAAMAVLEQINGRETVPAP